MPRISHNRSRFFRIGHKSSPHILFLVEKRAGLCALHILHLYGNAGRPLPDILSYLCHDVCVCLGQVFKRKRTKILFAKKDKQVVKELELICNDFSEMVEKGYYGGACEADVKFHEKMIESSGNDRLISMYKNSNIPLFHMRLGAVMDQMEDYQDTDREHREIVKGLATDNWELSHSSLVRHLYRGEQEALELV
ncbi:MAG: FCD domain-containing protein [Flavobacteriales bacterium]|nr:MAG: FCD domain-containing protein [Flavobacteriales bacterium]